MNAAEIKDLTEARAALARQRNAIAKRLAGIDLAPVSMAEDLTRVLVAIEALTARWRMPVLGVSAVSVGPGQVEAPARWRK